MTSDEIKQKYFFGREDWTAVLRLLPKDALWRSGRQVADNSPWDLFHGPINDILVAIECDDDEGGRYSWLVYDDSLQHRIGTLLDCLPLGEELRKMRATPLTIEKLDF